MNPELLEEMAHILHRATTIRTFTPLDAPKWEDLAPAIQEGYRGRAEDVITILGLDYEWAGQYNTQVGRIEQPYVDEQTARLAVEEGAEETPGAEWTLVRRIVSDWDVAN